MIGGFKCKAELKFLESVINLNKNRGIKGSRCLNYHKSLVANQIHVIPTERSGGVNLTSSTREQWVRYTSLRGMTNKTKYSKPGNLWKK